MMPIFNIFLLRQAIGEMTGSDLLANALHVEKESVLQAAKETEFNIYIENEAYSGPYWVGTKPIPGLIAIYTWDREKDHTPFWTRWKELQIQRIQERK